MACGAVVLEILIAFPAKFEAMLISAAFFKSGLFKKEIKLIKEISKDLDAYSTLSTVDFLATIDSKAWAIASNPAEAFTLLGADVKNSGIRKKESGNSKLLSNECLIPLT